MTTSSRKSYNIQALRGDKGQDDMDVVQQYNLDPALAYTPEINKAAIDAQYQDNIDAGVSEEDAAKYRMHYTAMAKKLMK